MADPTVGFEATDLFGLAPYFEPQSSGTVETSSNIQMLTSDGDVSCERDIFDITTYSQSYKYCGSDFIADLGTFLTEFGNVESSILVESLTINFAASDYVTIDVSGHNHAENAHTASTNLNVYDVSEFLPHDVAESFVTWDGFGIPDFGLTLGTTATPASASVSFTLTHTDQIKEDGQHFVGQNTNAQCSLSMTTSGIPTSNTVATIQADLRANGGSMLTPLVDELSVNDSNSDFDQLSFTAHSSVQRA